MDHASEYSTDEPEQTTDLRQDASGKGMYQVWMLAISLSILQIGFGLITPIFPFYIVELGVGATELGVLAASFALTRILLAGPLGRVSDKVGRKPVLLIALFGFAISNLIYAFAESILVMILARALEGAISAGFYPAANAFVSDMTIPENRGRAMGYLSTGNMVGFVVGPSLGGILAEFLGIRLPFVVAAVVTLGTLALVYVLVKEPPRTLSEEDYNKYRVPVLEVFSRNKRAYSALAVSMFANMFSIGILEVAFMLDAVQRFEFTPMEIGIFFGVLGIITIIGNIAFGRVSDRLGRKWLIVVGTFVGAVSLFMFMIATGVVGFYLAGAILGIAISMRGPTIQAMIADLTDQTAYGSVMGAFGAVSNSAYVVGPILGGMMYDSSGDSISSLALAGGVSVVVTLISAAGLPNYIPKSSAIEYTEDEMA
ncbi:MAG: MFS transporter [Candidatus Thorarchaeota archaeon]|jgi:multidrug resistance protein